MSTSGGWLVHIQVGHGLLIQQSECQVMADSTVRTPLMVSTALICSIHPTDVQSCWLFVCWALSFDSCAQCYGISTSPQPCCR